jgi:hypothetical protein
MYHRGCDIYKPSFNTTFFNSYVFYALLVKKNKMKKIHSLLPLYTTRYITAPPPPTLPEYNIFLHNILLYVYTCGRRWQIVWHVPTGAVRYYIRSRRAAEICNLIRCRGGLYIVRYIVVEIVIVVYLYVIHFCVNIRWTT